MKQQLNLRDLAWPIFVIVNLGTAVVMSQNFGAGNKAHAEAATRVAIVLIACCIDEWLRGMLMT